MQRALKLLWVLFDRALAIRYRPDQIDRLIRYRLAYLVGGPGLMLLAFILPQGMKGGAISGAVLIGLGVYGSALKRWRTEPGLWMLAAFLFVVLGTIYAF